MTRRSRRNQTKKSVRVDEIRPWADLPIELLELIASLLCVDDVVRLSCVCKKYRALHVVNQSPWLMLSPAIGGSKGPIFKFFDPSQGKFYVAEVPDLGNRLMKCSKSGWVLFVQLVFQIFLFNPFSKSRIELPRDVEAVWYPCSKLALSCAPTAPDCVVFSITRTFRELCISICHPGDCKWKTVKYKNTDGANFRCGDGPVFCNGLVYCLSETSDNLVGVFDPEKYTWSILPVPSPKLPHQRVDQLKAKHLVDFKGKLLLVCVYYPDKPFIFRLDLTEMKWVEMDTLNGVTVFVSALSSLSTTDIPSISRNSIYFSRQRFTGKSAYLYSLDDCVYHPAKQLHEARKVPKTAWIEPPKMSHLLFQETRKC